MPRTNATHRRSGMASARDRQRRKGSLTLLSWGYVGCAALGVVLLLRVSVDAQLTDVTQTPNPENAGIGKSLEQQIGDGRGDPDTPNTSLFIIHRDPFRAVRRGRQLFQRKFTVAQGFGPRINDGIGDIAANPGIGNGLLDNCAGCHANPRGSAGSGGAILFVRPDHRDAPHLFGVGLKEMLADEITTDLRAIRAQAIEDAQQRGRAVVRRLHSKGINYGHIRALPDGEVDTSLVEGVDADLRVRPLFAEGRRFSIRELTVVTLEEAMGLEACDSDTETAAEGERVVTPSGLVLDGALDRIRPPPVSCREDPEIPENLLDFFEFYLLHYFKPGTYQQTEVTRQGRQLLEDIGCTTCHVPDLRIRRDRRVADVETVYDPVNGIFNSLFGTATPSHDTIDDGSGLPTLKPPLFEPFQVRNIFTDFKRHDLGPNFHERNFNGTMTTHFLTAPLWGVGSTPPYGHDGRSINLREVILRHGGEAQAQRDAFAQLSERRQEAILRFLESLIIFPPDDTASNLDPGNPSAPDFPQRGHGSVRVGALFNDPSDVE